MHNGERLHSRDFNNASYGFQFTNSRLFPTQKGRQAVSDPKESNRQGATREKRRASKQDADGSC